MVSLIEPLGFSCRIEAGVVQVAVPTWRPDCTLEVDIIEEVARRYGAKGYGPSIYIADPDGHGIEVLYELPPDVWEGDVNGALNFFQPLP